MQRQSFPIRWCALLVLASSSCTSSVEVLDVEAMRATLAPSGTLRAAFLGRNPVQIQVDEQTGEIGGPAADVARALANRLGVELEIQPLSGVPAVIEAIENGAADIGFIAHDATRAQRVEFTQAYIYGHNSYIVPADSPIRTFTDADRAGVRISAISGNAVDLHLSRTLSNAELVSLTRGTPDMEAARMILAGELDAYAANKQRLATVVANEPRVRMLDGSVLPVEQSIVVSQENGAIVAQLDLFIDAVRDSGVLQEIVERYAIAGVEVAPQARR